MGLIPKSTQLTFGGDPGKDRAPGIYLTFFSIEIFQHFLKILREKTSILMEQYLTIYF